MLHRIAIGLVGTLCFALTFASGGCSHRDPLSYDPPPDADGVSFANADAATSAPDAELVSYCPASSCPAPHATCPGSQFSCDVNLMTDPANCGSCGFVCPASVSLMNASFACIAGKCVMTCADHGSFDGNGIPDDGCETPLGTNENCNDPGDRCPDPAKQCVWDGFRQNGTCGCAKPGFTACSSTPNSCFDLKTDDNNCGLCGNACSSTSPDGGPLAADTYYGCVDGACGHVKCTADRGDCDGKAENGCESDLLSAASCGACGHACAPGQTCIRSKDDGSVFCGCAPGLAYCPFALSLLDCVDLSTNANNCGGCGNDCALAATDHGFGLCKYGSCEYECMAGWGDCNADPEDVCETNLNTDPRNCGGCGITCAIGQPCIAGVCAVEPCRPEEATK